MSYQPGIKAIQSFSVALVASVAGAAVATGSETGAGEAIEIDAVLRTHDHDFNAALADAVRRLTPTGGVIYLSSAGEYEAKSRTSITRPEGDAEIVITTRSGDPATINQRNGKGDLLALRSARNLRFENLRLVGRRDSGGNGVMIRDTSGIRLRNVVCQDAGAMGIRISAAADTQMTEVTVDNARAHGVRIANCTDLTLDGVSIIEAGMYGIGVQDGTQLTTGLKILNSRIVRSRGDGIDVKGQREDGPPLVVIDGLEVIGCGGRKSAALDLRGHVAVKNVSIKLNPGSTGLRFRLGTDIGAHEATNGWAGYGSAERVTIESDSSDGIGIVIQSGDVTLSECSVSGPVEKKAEVYEWANKRRPVVLRALSLDGQRITSQDQFLASGGTVSKQPTLVFE